MPRNLCQCTVKVCRACRTGQGSCTCTIQQCSHCRDIAARDYGKCACHPH